MNFKIGLLALALYGCFYLPLQGSNPKPNTNFHSNLHQENDDNLVHLAMNMSDLLNDYNGLTEEEYLERIQSLSSEIEFRIDPLIKERIELRLSKAKIHTEALLGKAEIYFPIFEEYLEKYEVPHLLKYLAIIESALEPRARSHAGAGGLWQFMPGTGRMYKMEISSTVDDRCDTYKATESAAQLLAKLKEYHGDWCLALASYNCGAGRVNKAIKTAGTTNYWEVRKYLPVETQKYVPYFMAMVYVGEYADLHEITPISAQKHLVQTDTIHYTGSTTLANLAKEVNVHIDTVRYLNPSYLKNYIPKRPDGSVIVLPAAAVAKMRGYEAQLDYLNSIQQENPIRAVRRINSYTDLERLARAFRCTVKDILIWNGINDQTQIKSGDLIAIRKFNAIKEAVMAAGRRPANLSNNKEAVVIPVLQVIALNDNKAVTMTSRDLAQIAAHNPQAAGAITQTTAVYAATKNSNAISPSQKTTSPTQAGDINISRERSRNLRNEPSNTTTTSIANIPVATVAAANTYSNTNTGAATNTNASTPIGGANAKTTNNTTSNNTVVEHKKTPVVVEAPKAPAVATTTPKPAASIPAANNNASSNVTKPNALSAAPVQAVTASTSAPVNATVIAPKAVQQQTENISVKDVVTVQTSQTDLQRSRARNLRQDYSQETPATILGESKNNPQVAAKQIDPQNENFQFHCVEPNETIWDIVKKYPNITSRELMETNKLSRNTDIYPGLILKVPVR